MDKPTVYIETTIAGHLTSRLPKQFDVAAQMLATREWWEQDRPNFDCYTSPVVLDEVGRGDPIPTAERLEKLAALPLVFGGQQVDELAELLLARAALPAKARYDAVHLAIAAVNGMDYLLTWNCRHLANATLRGKIEQVCRDSNVEPPIICTPVELRELQP
jgi:predicted nucleic acid-binding protein